MKLEYCASKKRGGMRLMSAAFCVFVFSGCAGLQPRKSPIWPWPKSTLPCQGDVCTAREGLSAYLAATMYCREVHNWYEASGDQTGLAQTGIGTFGVLAGSVAAPLSTGNAAKAWAGLSGATNAMQSSIKDNLSGSLAIKRTKAVLDATTSGQLKFSQTAHPTDQVLVAINMAVACAMAPAAADGAAMKALSGQ